MKSFRRYQQSINAGSMADIAFLLLIFFLVTTTISVDKGILRTLPSDCPTNDCADHINERNVLRIFLNHKQQIMVDDKVVELKDVKTITKAFLDNNGDDSCNYCNGNGMADASDNPKEAIISLQHEALVKYNLFIEVQDELTQAYLELREAYAMRKFNKRANELSKKELSSVKAAYPFKISEALIKRTN